MTNVCAPATAQQYKWIRPDLINAFVGFSTAAHGNVDDKPTASNDGKSTWNDFAEYLKIYRSFCLSQRRANCVSHLCDRWQFAGIPRWWYDVERHSMEICSWFDTCCMFCTIVVPMRVAFVADKPKRWHYSIWSHSKRSAGLLILEINILI